MVAGMRKFNSVMPLLSLHPMLVLSFPRPHKELYACTFTVMLLTLPELAASTLSLKLWIQFKDNCVERI